MTPANKFLVAFTGIIAISTVVYAIVAGLQLTALLESNRINRESLQSVQRAFISFQGINQDTIIERSALGETEDFHFAVNMMNTGNTPANGEYQYLFGGELPDEPTEEQFRGSPSRVGRVIGPKAPHAFGDYKVPIA